MKRIILFLLLVAIPLITLLGQARVELSLKNAIDRTLANNPALGASLEAVGVQKAEFWRAISPPPPTVSVNYGFIPWGQRLDAFSERTVEVSQTIDFPTTIFLRGAQASHQVNVAEEDYASARNEMLARTTIAYFNVLAKTERLELAKENRSMAEDFAHKSAIRRNVGEGTNLEQLTANVQFAQAKNAVETAMNDLRAAKGELGMLIGLTKEAEVSGLFLTDSLVTRPLAANLERLIDIAQVSNAQIRSKMFRKDAASTGRALAWSSILPSFSASYLRQTRDGVTGLYGASFGISVPLWFMFDQRGQIESASSALAIADHELKATRQAVVIAVRAAYFEKVNCEEQLRSFESDVLRQAGEILRSAKASYEVGEISYLEFLQARQTVVQARANYIDVLLSYRVAVARLEQAVGSPLN